MLSINQSIVVPGSCRTGEEMIGGRREGKRLWKLLNYRRKRDGLILHFYLRTFSKTRKKEKKRKES
jgi:hypothetical protein